MLTTAEASRAIAGAMPGFDATRVALDAASGRILRQAVHAERDQPPFDRVTMDGIAIRFERFAAGQRRFPIAFTQHAGDPMTPLQDPTRCAEVMTGTALPEGADTVIPVERISVNGGQAELEAGYAPTENQFVHARASDHGKGLEILKPGARITPLDVAILASCGLADVAVTRTPVVRVVSTGNELVPAGRPVADHQIRLSNGPALEAMLKQQGFSDSTHDHLPDQPDLLNERIAAHLERADVLVLSGGVSMGKADFVPGVLESLGVRKVFHRVSQRPGKPLWFGTGPRGQAVFALPGNPVSALVCCRHYVLPALLAASGIDPVQPVPARLEEAVDFTPALTFFLPVRLSYSEQGEILATPVATNTSGDFTALGGTDGYVELDAEQQAFAAGQVVPCHRWDRP